MADNTAHYRWVTLLEHNLDAVLQDFVAADLLWYPVERRPDIRIAPDVLIALGRPKGDRSSYRQFEEDGVPPAVVFEVLSPGNSGVEMVNKAVFAFQYGARELIVIDPVREDGYALLARDGAVREEIPSLVGWTSPTLGIRFERSDDALVIYRPDGSRFRDYREREEESIAANARADRAEAKASEQASLRAEAEARAARLAARLAALGVSLDDV
jgi:Uma2 family endonuclease